MTILYLACPYHSPDIAVRQHRVAIATIAAAALMKKGHVVFSPITHGHPVSKCLPHELRDDFSFWMGQCIPILEKASLLVILPLPGWRESLGVMEEIFTANMRGLRIAIVQSMGNVKFNFVSPEEMALKNWELIDVE